MPATVSPDYVYLDYAATAPLCEEALEAMKPYLAEKRRRKIDRAMKLARLASLAELAAEDLEGDDHV